MTTAGEPLTYRLLTGPDDTTFCERVSQALAEGYQLHGSPAVSFDGHRVIAAQAVVLPAPTSGHGPAGAAAGVDRTSRAAAPHAPGGSMPATHSYQLSLHWTGNRGGGTSNYRAYTRDHELQAPGKPTIAGSADPAFRGDPQRWNPEELLVASLAQCHMLWYLHLAAMAGVIVTAYSDSPTGRMVEDTDGGGQFSEVVLHPTVTVAQAGMRQRAHVLHEEVDALCFVARSVLFPVHHQPTTRVAEDGVPQMGDTQGD